MQVLTTTFPVEILTAHFQVSGDFIPRGNPAIYLNDVQVQTLVVEGASAQPLANGAKLKQMTSTPAFIPKDEVQLLTLDGFAALDALLMPKAIRLLVFTDTYVVRGTFYTGAETPPHDIFVQGGPFYPATDVEIYTIRPLEEEISGGVDLAYIHRDAVRLFYAQT